MKMVWNIEINLPRNRAQFSTLHKHLWKGESRRKIFFQKDFHDFKLLFMFSKLSQAMETNLPASQSKHWNFWHLYHSSLYHIRSFLITALLRYISHMLPVAHLKCTGSMVVNIFTQLCSHPLQSILEYSHHPKRNPETISSQSLYFLNYPSPRQSLIYFMFLWYIF